MKLKIKDIAEIQIGYQFRKRLEPELDGTHRVIQIRDFDENQNLNVDGLCRVKLPEVQDKYLVNQSDVLFLSRGHRNFAYPILELLDNTIVSGYFFILKIKSPDILPEYLAWFINQTPAQEYLYNIARRGSHMPVVPKSDFENLKVNIPDIEIQQKIVHLNNLFQKEQNLLNTLQEKRILLMRSLCLKAAKKMH